MKMTKVLLLLLGLCVAGFATYAVPKEIKQKPDIIKVFVISENENVSVDAYTFAIVDADVGVFRTYEITIDDSKTLDVSPALHSEIFQLDISWQDHKKAYLQFNKGKPISVHKQFRHPVSYFYRS